MTVQGNSRFDRVLWIVIDGVGVGALPDAKKYGDVGSNTLGNCARELQKRFSRTLHIPNLEALGMANLTPVAGSQSKKPGEGEGACGRALEKSLGKDTTSGHWELAGLVVSKPFATYPNGFSHEVIQRWCHENNLPGVLGNKPASGTEIIEEMAEEHIRTGKPILYTSADSVWQVAAHEESFGLERLYRICESARAICDELQISRVIARPFIGNPAKGQPYKRTYHRHDYAQLPFGPTFLDVLTEKGVPTLGIGKISSIYAGRGIKDSIETAGNADGIRVILEQMAKVKSGLIFCNLIDFDMQYGHRRDIEGFANAVEEFDRTLPAIKKLMTPKDLLVIVADHGNDPSFMGSDHTREYIPILTFSPAQKTKGPIDLGIRNSFSDVGATITEALLGELPRGPHQPTGDSFLDKLV